MAATSELGVGVKRSLDLDELHSALPAMSHMSCAGAAAHLSAEHSAEHQFAKRQRFNQLTASEANVPVGAAVRSNFFPPPKPLNQEELEGLVASIHSPFKRHVDDSSPRPAPTGGEKQYTHEELKAVVTKVVGQREASLRDEYNQILTSKLAEQFQSFTKFNQDYISRQIKGNPFSYVS